MAPTRNNLAEQIPVQPDVTADVCAEPKAKPLADDRKRRFDAAFARVARDHGDVFAELAKR